MTSDFVIYKEYRKNIAKNCVIQRKIITVNRMPITTTNPFQGKTKYYGFSDSYLLLLYPYLLDVYAILYFEKPPNGGFFVILDFSQFVSFGLLSH